jgi:hypothetical protein
MKTFCAIVLLLSSFTLKAQVKVTPKNSIKTQTHQKQEGGKYFSEYVVKPEKLKTFFHTGQIPTSFPKYDKLKTYDENKSIAKQWAKNNKGLIKQEFWYKFEN